MYTFKNITFLIAVFIFSSSIALAATSENHELILGQFNYGSGSRGSENYIISCDSIGLSVANGVSSSPGYAMMAGFAGLILGPVTTINKAGDCNADNKVDIAEVQSAINMFLGLKPVQGCVDIDNSATVSISEVQKVINAFLGL